MRPRRPHLLANALREESALRPHVRGGLGAIERRDLRLIDEVERTKAGDSLDLDTAAREELPDENRWDYLVSLPASSRLIGIEPHTARDSEVSVVIAKKKQALAYLREHLQDGFHVAEWFWVTHGSVGFSRMDRARRLLDQNGITFAGRALRGL